MAVLLEGCDLVSDTICTLEARPAVELRATDKVTGLQPETDSLLFVVRDGVYADTLIHIVEGHSYVFPGDTLVAQLALERKGTYHAMITGPGYQEWRREGIRVKANECHVETEVVIAPLERKN